MRTYEQSSRVVDYPKSQASKSEGRIQKVLVAIEPSRLATDIFEEAVEIAEIHRSRLMIFHCLERSPTIKFNALLTGLYREDRTQSAEEVLPENSKELLTWLRSLHLSASRKNITTEFDYQIGKPGSQICSLAKVWGADLIVIGSRKQSSFAQLFSPGVSNYVVHHAPCAVQLVQP